MSKKLSNNQNNFCQDSHPSLEGFSFVELLVVLGIISLIFTVGYANLRGYQRKQAVMAAARQIEGDLRMTHGYASQGYKPNLPPQLPCTAVEAYIFQINSDYTYDIIANCPTDVVVKDNVGIGMTLTPAESFQFKVLEEGTDLPVGGKTICLTSPENIQVKIVVSQSGTVTMDFAACP